jgi:hypothetical protein
MSSPGNQLAPQSKANKRFSIAVTVWGFRSEKMKWIILIHFLFENFSLV